MQTIECIALLGAAALVASGPLTAQSPLAVEKRALGGVSRATVSTLAGAGIFVDVATTGDGRRLATIRYAGSRQFVDLDGTKSQEWDDIGIFSLDKDPQAGPQLVFSPDGSRLAYIARQGARVLLVVDNKGVEIEPDSIKRAGVFRFSPDGSQYAMIVVNARKGEAWVVANGVKNGPYGSASEITFSADGKHLGYMLAII